VLRSCPKTVSVDAQVRVKSRVWAWSLQATKGPVWSFEVAKRKSISITNVLERYLKVVSGQTNWGSKVGLIHRYWYLTVALEV